MAVTEYVILVPISILLNATFEGSTQLPTFLTEWSSKRFETRILIWFLQRLFLQVMSQQMYQYPLRRRRPKQGRERLC